MTPDESEDLLNWYETHKATILAHANGKKIEFYDRSGKNWTDVWDGPEWDRRTLYRVKPEPKTRHYTDAELKQQVGKVLQRRSTGDTHLVAGYSVQNKTLSIFLFGSVRADFLFDEFTHLDGSPCGVTE